jgi:predicted Zn-ribbon and HTH transcriptional regulator
VTGADDETRAGSERDVIAFKCERCGDTFTAHVGERPACPTCKSKEVHEAHEPLL